MVTPCVLAVDDDSATLRIIEAALQPAFAMVSARDLAAAKEAIASSPGRFDCVLIDYHFPDGYGTELLHWLHQTGSPLAAIMVTASEEAELVRQTMVGGACNFLRKPIDREQLRLAVEAAVATTRQRRQVSEMRSQVRTAGRNQGRLLEAMLHSDAFAEYLFTPKDECGGDFLVHHRFPNGGEVFIVSDVAGHDIDATVQSSFFHGWMTGALRSGGGLQDALTAYNQRLVESQDMISSIAVTAVEISNGCCTGWTCGGPPPVYVDSHGWIQSLGERYSSPLGWFDTLQPTIAQAAVPQGPIWMWTDGLDLLASALRADPLSVAYALLASRAVTPRSPRPDWFALAHDDVLVARIWPGASSGFVPSPYFHPLVCRSYSRACIAGIDDAQSGWRTSLSVALPQLGGDTVHDLLLASREALLNALHHGCRGDEAAIFQILYHPVRRTLQVRVSDPGAGHDFDWRGSPGRDCHYGLLMVHNITSRVDVKRAGAELILDFILDPAFHILHPEAV